VAKKYAKEMGLYIEIDSAGVSSYHQGEAPCHYSQKIAKINGIDISDQRSRPICVSDKQFDLIVAMDRSNREDLRRAGFKNVVLLGEYGGFAGSDVPDPFYYPDFEGFEKVFSMIDIAVKDLFKKHFS
jgi:protein-tyrosine phosphatase